MATLNAADDNSLRTIQAVDKALTTNFIPTWSTTDAVWGDFVKTLDNKATASITFKDNAANAGKELSLATVTADSATVDAASNVGQTFTLTKGVNDGADFTGTAGNDTFKANYDAQATAAHTLGALDVLDGGAGTDTLAITNDSLDDTTTALVNEADYTMAAAMISNIENITIRSGGAVTANVSGSNVTGLNSIAVTQATAATLTAAATTDVNVSGVTGQTTTTGGNNVTVAQDMNATAGSGVQVNTAKNVTITATDSVAAALGINVGAAAATAATGTVTINATGAAVVGNDNAVALDAITVFGGTSVNITQVAAASYGNAASTNADLNDIITQGAVIVNTTNNTTDITITQDAARSAVNAANTTGAVTETASVKFGALKAGDALIIAGNGDTTTDAGEIKLTATVDMTAAEVAAAFANLVNDAAKGTVAAGDTQSGAVYTKATYTGVFTAWTSGVATGDTVVFTSTTANNTATDFAFNLAASGGGAANAASVAPIVTTTQGKANDATMAGGVTGIVAGAVTIAAGTTATALTEVTVNSYGAGSAITGTAAALATINLSNGAAFSVSDTASTVTLNLEKTTGAVTFIAQPTTLNVNSIGDNTGGVVAAAVTTALNVSGTGTLTSAGSLAAVKTITVTETAGLNLTSATLTALESVNTTGTTGTTTVQISGTQATYTGGAGVDNVTVGNAGTSVTKAIDLGAGNDKLTLVGATVVVPTATLNGGEGTDTLSIDAASAVVANLSADGLFAAKLNSFERLEITGATGAQSVNVANLGFANYVTVAGVAANGTLTLNDLANNANVVLNAATGTGGLTTNVKDAATGTADVINVEVTNNSTIAAGTLTATNTETVNLTVTDSNVTSTTPQDAVHTMTLTADKATALTVDGNAGLTLTLTGTNALATVTATDMTATLTLDLSAHNGVAMTVNGGSGADVLTATVDDSSILGNTAKADILNGGAGNDTLIAGTNGAKLTGGAGNDLFVLTDTTGVGGTTEATTHSYITDFQAGDLLQLSYWNGAAAAVVTGFAKLTANQSANATYSNYVDAAMAQMNDGTAGDAVWFSFAGNSYVIVDSGADSAGTFTNGEDLAIELTGVANLDNASFNSTYGTIAIG